MFPEEMPFDAPVLGSAGDLLIGCQVESCRVVFIDGCCEFFGLLWRVEDVLIIDINQFNMLNELKDNLSNRYQGSHGLAESTVLCFTGTESYS